MIIVLSTIIAFTINCTHNHGITRTKRVNQQTLVDVN